MYGANKHRKDAIKKDFTVYRGFNLSHAEVEEYRRLADAQNKGQMHLMGFTSTLMDKKEAESFALLNLDPKRTVAVLAKITMNTRYKYFQMDRAEYNAYFD